MNYSNNAKSAYATPELFLEQKLNQVFMKVNALPETDPCYFTQGLLLKILNQQALYNMDISVTLIEYDENETIDEITGNSTRNKPDIIMYDSRLINRIYYRELLNISLTEDIINALGQSDFYTASTSGRWFSLVLISYPSPS